MTLHRLRELLLVACVGAGLLIVGMGSASAGVILSTTVCNASHVFAGAPINSAATSCIGLIDKSGGGQPNSNDSPTLLNNSLTATDTTVIWDSFGAFGINTWSRIGKDDQATQTFIDVTSGSPATWTVSSALLGSQSYVFAAKQGNLLGLYYFPNLAGVTTGTVDMNAIFGDGTGDDGWSHFAIYTSDASNPFIPMPEPGALSLLGLGLLGLGLSRRRLRS